MTDRDKTDSSDRATRDRARAEIAASIAEKLTGLAKMALDQKLVQLHALLDTAIRQAEYDATSERKSTSRKRKVA